MTWQLDMLQKFIDEHRREAFFNSYTVFLTNTKEEEELDDIIIDEIYPAVVKATEPHLVSVNPATNKIARQEIRTTQHKYTRRELVFLLEDPLRPFGPLTSLPWYCRGKIEVGSLGYTIHFDFMIYLPPDFSLTKVRRILKEPLLRGLPPNLSFDSSGVGSLCISLTSGSGAGWGIQTYNDAWEKAYSRTMNNIALINAVTELESDYKSSTLFNKLHKAIIGAYEAC